MKKLEYSCGLGSVRPSWMQRFANTKCFMVVYSLLGTVQGMSYIYMSTTLTTLEKRFKIPSQTIGILMSGNEVSQVFLSLAMSYHGGRGNRPLWISWGVTFSAISCFILALPHLVYGPGKDAIALTEEFLDTTVLNSSIPKTNDRALLCSGNKTALAYCEEDVSSGEHSLMPLILIFFSQFVLGIGTTLFHSLGQTYLDDHTKKTNAPLLLGMVLSLRMLGPAAGFAFSSFCLSLYIDPTLTPVIKPTDPRWLGAWWLGWLVLGVLMLVFAFLISWFPRELPPKKKKRAPYKVEKNKDRLIKTPNNTSNNKLSSESEPLNKGAVTETLNKIPIKIKKQEDDEGFMDSLKGLLQNKLLIYNIFAGVFYVMGEAGTMTFSMKYMEIQYHTSAAGASMISGSASVFAMIFGFLGSGYFIGRFKPRPRLVLGWNVILGAVHVIGSIIYIYLGCQDKGVYGLDPVTGKLDVGNSCNMGCECDDLKYQPVCYREKDITFYSACHIGCNDTIHSKNGSTTSFTNCTCLPFTQDTTLSSGLSSSLTTQHPLYAKDLSAVMTNGPCPVDCTRILYTYILVGFFIQALSSSGRIGNVLVNFRCVKQKDKVFAQGLSLLLVSLFAFIPGPILFGAMIDSSCLLWDASCGEKGNCWLYQKDKFRIYMNVTAAVLTSLGVILDIKVWHLGKTLDLYGDTDELSSDDRRRSSAYRSRQVSLANRSRQSSLANRSRQPSIADRSRQGSVSDRSRRPSFVDSSGRPSLQNSRQPSLVNTSYKNSATDSSSIVDFSKNLSADDRPRTPSEQK